MCTSFQLINNNNTINSVAVFHKDSFSSSSFAVERAPKTLHRMSLCKVCTISFERPVNYLCDASSHVFPPKYEAWTHFNRPWTEYQCQGVVWTLLITFTESVNRSTCLSVYLIITRLRNVNLLCFSDSIEGIDFLNCTLKCPVILKLTNQNLYFY